VGAVSRVGETGYVDSGREKNFLRVVHSGVNIHRAGRRRRGATRVAYATFAERKATLVAAMASLGQNTGMNLNSTITSPETEILSRVVGPENPSFTTDVARSILELRFSDADTDRMNRLAEKARQESLSEEEQSQLHGYLFVCAMKAPCSRSGRRLVG
jgi:hypothetical protein